MINPMQLIDDFRKLGVREDDTIIVHSSYNALKGGGQIDGGPAAVIAALKELVKHGTLMLPTLSWEAVSPSSSRFVTKETKSCVGILPEIMRKSEGVVRSVHPTHSVAIWGKDAQKIAGAHIRDFTPVGPNSPFHEVRRRNGKIIMLGCGLESNTSMHGVEELIAPFYVYGENTDYELVLENGETVTQAYLNHGFDGIEQRYERILDLLSPEEYAQGKVLNADCTVYSAKALWDKGIKKMREDKLYFVDVEGAK